MSEYVPFGDEWKKHVAKLPKRELVEMLAKALARKEYKMNEMERKGQLIKKYILSLVYEDEVPEIVNRAIDELVQAAQQGVQADTRHVLDGTVVSDDVIPF